MFNFKFFGPRSRKSQPLKIYTLGVHAKLCLVVSLVVVVVVEAVVVAVSSLSIEVSSEIFLMRWAQILIIVIEN